MKTYTMRYKRNGFFQRWKKVGPLIGHKLDRDQNKMVVYYQDGSIQEIVDWNSCGVYLGTDYILFEKESMEKSAGQNIKLNVDTGSK